MSPRKPRAAPELPARVADLAKRNPGVRFRGPGDSPSGQWEAEGPRWVIIEGSAERLCDVVTARITA